LYSVRVGDQSYKSSDSRSVSYSACDGDVYVLSEIRCVFAFLCDGDVSVYIDSRGVVILCCVGVLYVSKDIRCDFTSGRDGARYESIVFDWVFISRCNDVLCVGQETGAFGADGWIKALEDRGSARLSLNISVSHVVSNLSYL